jgi:hypothetical protein
MLCRDLTGKSLAPASKCIAKAMYLEKPGNRCYFAFSASLTILTGFSLHICVTLQHTTVYDQFLKDLQDSVNTVSCSESVMLPNGYYPDPFPSLGKAIISYDVWRRQVKANPGPISGGKAPIYGAAGKMPDRGTVRELLVEFMDSSC